MEAICANITWTRPGLIGPRPNLIHALAWMHMLDFVWDSDQETLNLQHREQIHVIELGTCKLTFLNQIWPSLALFSEMKLKILWFVLLFLSDIENLCKTQIQMNLDLDNRI